MGGCFSPGIKLHKVWEDLLEEQMAIHSVFLPGELHGQRSLAAYSLWGRRVGYD